MACSTSVLDSGRAARRTTGNAPGSPARYRLRRRYARPVTNMARPPTAGPHGRAVCTPPRHCIWLISVAGPSNRRLRPAGRLLSRRGSLLSGYSPRLLGCGGGPGQQSACSKSHVRALTAAVGSRRAWRRRLDRCCRPRCSRRPTAPRQCLGSKGTGQRNPHEPEVLGDLSSTQELDLRPLPDLSLPDFPPVVPILG